VIKAPGLRIHVPYASSSHPRPGRNEITLTCRPFHALAEIALIHLLGPHFSDGLSGPWSWEYSPQAQPPGTDYRRFPSGLADLPRLRSL